jgi:hypothetical protein
VWEREASTVSDLEEQERQIKAMADELAALKRQTAASAKAPRQPVNVPKIPLVKVRCNTEQRPLFRTFGFDGRACCGRRGIPQVVGPP